MPSVTRRNRSNRTERRESVQRDLLGAVERLLESGESYTELSVERLVAEAGVSRSTFYVYFEDKGDLLRAIADEVLVEITDAGRKWWRLPPGADKSDLQAALDRVSATYRSHWAIFVAVSDTAAYDQGVREQFSFLMQAMSAELADHIRTGQEQGYVNTGLDPVHTAGWLTWMGERGLNQLVAGTDDKEAEAILNTLVDIVWKLLYEGTR